MSSFTDLSSAGFRIRSDKSEILKRGRPSASIPGSLAAGRGSARPGTPFGAMLGPPPPPPPPPLLLLLLLLLLPLMWLLLLLPLMWLLLLLPLMWLLLLLLLPLMLLLLWLMGPDPLRPAGQSWAGLTAGLAATSGPRRRRLLWSSGT